VFDALRAFDDSDVTEIYAQCPDNRGLGLAIGNRLKKAAGFHVIESDSQRVVLGITGCTGAGKTSALDAIRDLGGKVIDCDAVYHNMLAENQEMRNTINAAFPGVFHADGTLDREKLGREVFAKKDRLAKLNDIVFHFVIPEVRRQVGDEDGLYAIDAINLLESGLDSLCDCTVAVTAPVELRVRRIMARDHITEEYARMRITSQKPDDYYRAKCTYELSNAAESPEAFRQEARLYFKRLIDSIKEEKAHGKV
jgi:L-threonylcarbamoyladenylate synthase